MKTVAASPTPAGCNEPDRLIVYRSDLEDALDEITVAYENAFAAADMGLLDFGPFDGLPVAIAILREVLEEEETA